MQDSKVHSTMQSLVNALKAQAIIKSSRVEQAMLKADRSHYLDSTQPYYDGPHTIGYNVTISAPHMHAHALEALSDKLVEGARVLDVGSGSGYLLSCMAHMVGSTGRVFGVEHIQELVIKSEANIRRDCAELLDSGRVTIVKADGREGLQSEAPFDAIHVGAAAQGGLPEKLVDQLREGGRMVLPVDDGGRVQHFEAVDKLAGGELRQKTLLGVIYVPLTDAKEQMSRS